MRHVQLAATVLVLFAGQAALAQTRERVYVQASHDTSWTSGYVQAMSGEAGVEVTSRLALFAVVGRLDHFAAPHLLRANPLVDGALTHVPGVTMSVAGTARYEAAGLRYDLARSRWTIRPYVRGAFGLASVSQQVRFYSGSRDVTGPLVRLDLLGHDPSGSFRAPLATVGFGAEVPVGHLRLDAGYRLSQFLTTSRPVRVGTATVAVGVGF